MRQRTFRSHARPYGWLLVVTSAVALQACKDLAGSSTVASGVLDPKSFNTPTGIEQRLDGIRTEFGIALNLTILGSGTLSDELSDGTALDKRQLPQSTNPSDPSDPALAYTKLQDVRVQADITAREIHANAIDVPSVVRGELYALQGYAEVLLADLYCSGIPLTTLDLSGAVHYEPGTRTDSVYAHAARLFDSASALSAGSASVMTLARVGKGRALLARGQYGPAASAVTAVATTDAYSATIILGVPSSQLDDVVLPQDLGTYSVSDREGGNGLPYRSSHDPRTETVTFTDTSGNVYYAPQKYQDGHAVTHHDSVEVVVAGGIEARLIEAEAQLHAGQVGPWLTTLNALRTNGSVTGLLPLSDPGTDRSRVDTLFAERAKWLFLTAHRQGDLRRLLRQYPSRSATQVYPAGRTRDGDAYGFDVTAPIPATERINRNFDGCFDRNP